MDDDGYIFIVDRKKDMMKTSGFQVWPREIEEVIAAHPAVHEVGVAGVPDAVKGEVAQAWVVLKPDRSVTEDELRAYCRERLAPYKVPARVEFRKELPKTMVGKVLRRVLAAETETGALTWIPASSSAFRIRDASTAAPGVSPCTQIVSHVERDSRSVGGDDDPLTRNRDGASHHDLFIIDDRTGLVARHE